MVSAPWTSKRCRAGGLGVRGSRALTSASDPRAAPAAEVMEMRYQWSARAWAVDRAERSQADMGVEW